MGKVDGTMKMKTGLAAALAGILGLAASMAAAQDDKSKLPTNTQVAGASSLLKDLGGPLSNMPFAGGAGAGMEVASLQMDQNLMTGELARKLCLAGDCSQGKWIGDGKPDEQGNVRYGFEWYGNPRPLKDKDGKPMIDPATGMPKVDPKLGSYQRRDIDKDIQVGDAEGNLTTEHFSFHGNVFVWNRSSFASDGIPRSENSSGGADFVYLDSPDKDSLASAGIQASASQNDQSARHESGHADVQSPAGNVSVSLTSLWNDKNGGGTAGKDTLTTTGSRTTASANPPGSVVPGSERADPTLTAGGKRVRVVDLTPPTKPPSADPSIDQTFIPPQITKALALNRTGGARGTSAYSTDSGSWTGINVGESIYEAVSRFRGSGVMGQAQSMGDYAGGNTDYDVATNSHRGVSTGVGPRGTRFFNGGAAKQDGLNPS